MSESPFPGYVHGAEAARLFGVARADSVWRAIARHRDSYPGRIEVVTVATTKMVRRDELERFAAWFLAGRGNNGRGAGRAAAVAWVETDDGNRVETDETPARRTAVTDERRARLRETLARLGV